jgi:hypothetical protein
MHIQNYRRPVHHGKPAYVCFVRVLLFVILFLGLEHSMANANDAYNLVFANDKEFLAPHGPSCIYDGISAACGHLQIKFLSFKNTAAVKHVLCILDKHKALRIGQIPSMGIIQVSVPDNQVIKLREDLKKTGLVIVTFEVNLSLNGAGKDASGKTQKGE